MTSDWAHQACPLLLLCLGTERVNQANEAKPDADQGWKDRISLLKHGKSGCDRVLACSGCAVGCGTAQCTPMYWSVKSSAGSASSPHFCCKVQVARLAHACSIDSILWIKHLADLVCRLGHHQSLNARCSRQVKLQKQAYLAGPVQLSCSHRLSQGHYQYQHKESSPTSQHNSKQRWHRVFTCQSLGWATLPSSVAGRARVLRLASSGIREPAPAPIREQAWTTATLSRRGSTTAGWAGRPLRMSLHSLKVRWSTFTDSYLAMQLLHCHNCYAQHQHWH